MTKTWIFDTDSHLTEPADLWTSRVESRHRDQVPHVVRDAEGKDVWILDGVQVSTVGTGAPAGWKSFPPEWPKTFEELHPAAYDPSERLEYMDTFNIWAQVLYPNVAGFGSQRFREIGDRALQLRCVRAYNEFLEEWAATDPRRLITILSTPFWDVDAMISEIEWGVEHGFSGILFTGEPLRFGLPTLGDPKWDPVWSLAQEAHLPIHFHIGGGEDDDGPPLLRPERLAYHGWPGSSSHLGVQLFMKNGVQCADLICSGVLARFPDLKFVSVESGVGWVPFVMEAADYGFKCASSAERGPDRDLLPSELFARQVYTTFWFEHVALPNLLKDLPLDRLMFETDFPHPACLYADEIEQAIRSGLGDASAEVRDRLIWGNAAELYGVATPDR